MSDKIRLGSLKRIQSIVLVISSVSIIANLCSKAWIADDASLKRFIDPAYFIGNITECKSAWPIIYWTSAATFVTSILIAIVLQAMRDK